jgi:hypothetical protein
MPIETPAFDSGVAITMKQIVTSAIIMNFFIPSPPSYDLTENWSQSFADYSTATSVAFFG